MNRAVLIAMAASLIPISASAQDNDEHMEIAKRVLSSVPLFDGHNDLPWAIRESEDAPRDVRAYDIAGAAVGHTDLDRLRAGMVGAQFWSVYVPFDAVQEGAARIQLEQIDIALQVIDDHPEHLELALTADDVMRVFHEGKVASLLGMEGGHAIENSLGALRAFYALGARYMTLTHGSTIDWADSGTGEAAHEGLTAFGREVVREMNWLGMLVDLSHTSPATMHDVLDVVEAPVIYSHSSAKALTGHNRNVPDEVLRRLPENGGVVMVTFVESFVNEEVRLWREQMEAVPESERGQAPRASLSDVADHIEHVRDVAGIDHVAIGGDFDGIDRGPVGLEDVSTYPSLFAELSRRGWSESELRQLAADNMLRVMRDVEAAARRLQAERGPSTATIEELDGPIT
jgi:membrane dipeptidase